MVAESGEDFIGTKCHLTQLCNGKVVPESGEDFIGVKCHLTQICNGQVVAESGEDFIGVKCHQRSSSTQYSAVLGSGTGLQP